MDPRGSRRRKCGWSVSVRSCGMACGLSPMACGPWAVTIAQRPWAIASSHQHPKGRSESVPRMGYGRWPVPSPMIFLIVLTVCVDEIGAARERIAPYLTPTPLLRVRRAGCGGRARHPCVRQARELSADGRVQGTERTVAHDGAAVRRAATRRGGGHAEEITVWAWRSPPTRSACAPRSASRRGTTPRRTRPWCAIGAPGRPGGTRL